MLQSNTLTTKPQELNSLNVNIENQLNYLRNVDNTFSITVLIT